MDRLPVDPDEDPRGDPLPRGASLHLDVSLGCAGDMLTAALLDLGAPLRALREALFLANLPGVGPRVRSERRGGLRGLHLCYVDGAGRALEVPEPLDLPRRRRQAGRARRPAPVPQPDVRTRPRVAEVNLRLGTGEEDDPGPQAEILPGPGQERAPGPPPGHVARWLAGEPCPAAELAHHLAHSRLPPLVRALSRKALGRLLLGHAKATGQSDEEWVLDGRHAVDVLCDVVGVAALLVALDPGEVTSTPLAVSTAPLVLDGHLEPGPSSWTLACADGLRIVERDLPHPCTSPTGAALVWALAHRQGPRSVSAAARVGTGLGTFDVPGVANACRIFLHEPAPLAAREGTAPEPGPAQRLRAVIPPGVDRPALVQALNTAGARSLSFVPTTGPLGEAQSEVWATVAPDDAPAALRALLVEGGADGVDVQDVLRHEPGRRDVTVWVGGDKKGRAVRVVETLLQGEVVRAEPDPAEVQAAARALGDTPPRIRAEALAAWRRLPAAEGGGPAPDGRPSGEPPPGASHAGPSEGDESEHE